MNDAPTGSVDITGTPRIVTQVLTATTGSLADIDGLGTLHYQWQHNTGAGFTNVGTDQSTYTLGAGDGNATVRVVVSYTDGHGTLETVASAATPRSAPMGRPAVSLSRERSPNTK